MNFVLDAERLYRQKVGDLKVALITGGTRGIGKAIVEKFRNEGIKVAVAARSITPPDCDLYVRHDLSEGAGTVVEQVFHKFGRIDILVNNAGGHQSYNDNYKLMADTPYQLARDTVKYMKTGHIINILSTSAIQGVRNVAGYVMAKHAALGMTRALALELAPDIHVNGIIPGLIDTDMTSQYTQSRRELLESLIPAHRFGQAEEIADAAWYLVNSSYVYGHSIIVDGGWMVKNG